MNESSDAACEMCGGPLGHQRWRNFFPICSKCELESIHDTPDLTGPYLDAYNRLRDIRNSLAAAFYELDASDEQIIEGEPVAEVIDGIADLAQTFLDTMVKPADEYADEPAD